VWGAGACVGKQIHQCHKREIKEKNERERERERAREREREREREPISTDGTIACHLLTNKHTHNKHNTLHTHINIHSKTPTHT